MCMIESWFFVLAMLAVLLIPGPTNALLASATHQQGVPKTIKFIPIEWLGYMYGISLWALLIHLFDPIWPALGAILHTASLLYVLWMAFHLWKSSHLQKHDQHHPHIRKRQLFMSTLKNPKTVLLAAGIFPSETWNSIENALMVFAVFSLILLPVSIFWMIFGRALMAGSLIGIKADHLYKGSAVLLLICMLPMIFRLF
ncbi:threonine transporter RhtB [Acinetobacter courvalinii]|uniref:Threonine transporter RhtB n=2 Tax=Acinetobacter courvalinii TaxID=280147 RepID=A0ABD0ABE8_9GAMM|nr:threonine transporter RhtB [Acinetobacter courvalinii]